MKFERKHAIFLLSILWVVVLYGMYSSLFGLGPLKEELLRYDGDPMRHGYKIFFFSMEAAAITYLAFTIVLVGAKIGIVFTTILLINGSIFSNLAWGAYWNWDPRETTTLFLWFILAAYLTLRTSIDSPETRARLSSVLGIFGFVGVPLTHISATIWVSNHPQLYNRAEGAGFSLDRSGLIIFMILMLSIITLFIYILWLTYKIEKIEQRYQNVLSGEQ
jgi:heme exporter protein C